MNNNLFLKAQKRWAEIGKHQPFEDMEKELAFYKKMLSIFQVGDFYFFLFCPSISEIEYVSDSIRQVLGFEPEAFTTDFFLNSIHPEDVPRFVEFENRVVDFKLQLSPDRLMKYKSQYYYRLRKADGSYIPVLQQSITMQSDENGAILRNLVVHTDISSINPQPSKSTLSFIGLEGEPSFYNVGEKKHLDDSAVFFTRRELEILELLALNKTSAEIGNALHISPSTVSTHRKNMHAKTGTHNVLELVMKAMEHGWLSQVPAK